MSSAFLGGEFADAAFWPAIILSAVAVAWLVRRPKGVRCATRGLPRVTIPAPPEIEYAKATPEIRV